jgi:hypothetical protein
MPSTSRTSRADYFSSLERELNSDFSFCVTEWLSFRIFNVEMAALGSSAETIEACVAGINDILSMGKARSVLNSVIADASVDESLKSKLLAIIDESGACEGSVENDEALAMFSLHCFAHFVYARDR